MGSADLQITVLVAMKLKSVKPIAQQRSTVSLLPNSGWKKCFCSHLGQSSSIHSAPEIPPKYIATHTHIRVFPQKYNHIRTFTHIIPAQTEDLQEKYWHVLLLGRNEVEPSPFSGSKCKISPFAETKEAQLIFHAGDFPLNFLPGHHYKARANEKYWFPPQWVKNQGTGMTERIC